VFFLVLQRAGATNVVLVTLMVPITAMLLGYWILGERITRQEIFGALVIGSALLLIDGRVLGLIRRNSLGA
jgi:drug/metabolite transporter (DMT)-like permease